MIKRISKYFKERTAKLVFKFSFVSAGAIGLVLLYVIIGLFFQKSIYSNKSNSKFNKTILYIYPFPAARVGNANISMKSLLKQVSYVSQFSKQTGQQVGSYDEIVKNTLDQLIETRLIKNELENQGIEIPQKEVDASYQKIIDENGGEGEVKKVIESLYQMSLSDFKGLIRDQLARDILNQKALKQAHVRHILLSDENQARDVTKAIVERNDPKFEDAARIFSKDIDTRDKGGNLNFISRGSMPENFEDVVYTKSKIGETYPEPIKTEFGWHIIKVDEIRGKIDKSYDKWLEEAKNKGLIIKFVK